MQKLDALCECGHAGRQHHASFLVGLLLEECEFYGWNENGGMRYVEDPPGGEPRWEEHCFKFREVQAAEGGEELGFLA